MTTLAEYETATRGACELIVRNGTYFPADTPERLLEVLERLRLSGERVRVHYGDTVTGRQWRDWEEGRISRTMGPCKVPIIVHNRRSLGGHAALVGNIVRITSSRKNGWGTFYVCDALRRGLPLA